MKKLKLSELFFLTFIFLLTAQGVRAQGPPPRPFPEEGKRERLREEIDTMKMWKMLEVLDLSQEQSDKFLPVWREMQKAQKDFREKRENLLKSLEAILGAEKPDEGKIRDILGQLEKERSRFDDIQQNFRQKAQEILTLEQQAKLVLFEDRFEKRMMEIIRQYRERKGFEQ
ncbi:MAG TPA: periplasmic heavy metal sensor [Terriglobales bacterium]|nr:periplasmic heavy metal sensor [Terriglobales bacterium]